MQTLAWLPLYGFVQGAMNDKEKQVHPTSRMDVAIMGLGMGCWLLMAGTKDLVVLDHLPLSAWYWHLLQVMVSFTQGLCFISPDIPHAHSKTSRVSKPS